MCECLRRNDGTWHVDECCAHVMEEYHSGGYDRSTIGRMIKAKLEEFENPHDYHVADDCMKWIVSELKDLFSVPDRPMVGRKTDYRWD